MIKKLGIIFIALFCGTQFLPAQNDIIVHNEKTGVDEEIDLPEGMVYEIISHRMKTASVPMKILHIIRKNTFHD